MSFVEETCYHAIMTGIYNDELREKVLSQAMMGNVKNLSTLLEYAATEEAAKCKKSINNVAGLKKNVKQHK